MIEVLGERGVAFSGESSRQVITAFVEERVANWVRGILNNSSPSPQAVLQKIVVETLGSLEKEDPEIRAASLLTPIELGFKKLVSLSLSFETVLRIKAVDPNVLDSQNGKYVAGNILRLAFLKVHPQEEPIQRAKPSPPNPIFRNLPPSLPYTPHHYVYKPLRRQESGFTKTKTVVGKKQTGDSSPDGSTAQIVPDRSRTTGVAELEKMPIFSPEEIKKHREVLGLSQAELAVSLEVGRSFITEAERGRKSGLRTLTRLTDGIRLLEAHPEHIRRNPRAHKKQLTGNS